MSENLLTDEECKIIEEMSKNPLLNMQGCCHNYRYYGVDKKGLEEEIKIIEDILIKWYPDLHCFSNFTGEEPNRIRIQAFYSRSFIGVHYLPLPSNEKENTDDL